MKTILRIVVLAQFVLVSVRAANVELISAAPEVSTQAAHGSSTGPVFSPDSRFVLFSSTAPDLVNLPGDSKFHLFLLDRSTHAVQLIDTNLAGGLANRDAEPGAMSSDNRYLVFQSSSSNLGPLDTNGVRDVYLRDLITGTTTLVSHNLDGSGAGNAQSEFPEISANGEWVVFESAATNLVAGDTNRYSDLFAWKRSDGSIRLVTAGPDGGVINAEPQNFSISADSRFVLFTATGANLVVPNKTGLGDVYLRDLEAGTTRWVSGALTNLVGFESAKSGNAQLSANGRFVFFVAATNTNRVLVRVDLTDNSIIKVFDNFPSEPSQLDELFGPSINDDGQFAAFVTATNVVYWNATTGVTEAIAEGGVSLDTTVCEQPVISHDGKKVLFLSLASDIVPGVGNGELQLYIYDATTRQTKLITHNTSGAATFGNDFVSASFSTDDSTVLFDTTASDLVVGDLNDDFDVFTYTLADGTISLLSSSRANAPSVTAFGSSSIGPGSVSADGRFVVFASFAKLSEKDTNQNYDVYVYDRTLKKTTLVSYGPDGFAPTNGVASAAIISSDGNIVVFESNAPGLAGPDDTSTQTKVYARDLSTGSLRNLTSGITGTPSRKMLSQNGQFVFVDANLYTWRYNLSGNTTVRLPTLSTAFASASEDGSRLLYTTAGSSVYYVDYSDLVAHKIDSGGAPTMSLDGTIIAYTKGTSIVVTNLVTGQTNQLPAGSRKPAISADVRIIAYEIQPVGGKSDVYFYDRSNGQNVLISRAFAAATGGNDNSTGPVLSADGRFIAFESWATDLVPSDANGLKDVFVYDRFTDRLIAASHPPGSAATGNSLTVNPALSADGSVVVFASTATDLVAGDLNESADIFAVTLDTTAPSEDQDGDGLNDVWERANFSTLSYGPGDDPDADGASNMEEARAGTNPASAASAFSISSFSTSVAANQLVFKSTPGKTYRVEFKATLAEGPWTAVGSDIPASAGAETTVNLPATGEGFYRLRLIE